MFFKFFASIKYDEFPADPTGEKINSTSLCIDLTVNTSLQYSDDKQCSIMVIKLS